MNMQPVPMREGQTIQCNRCLKMHDKIWADLDGPAYESYYCETCKKEVEHNHKA